MLNHSYLAVAIILVVVALAGCSTQGETSSDTMPPLEPTPTAPSDSKTSEPVAPNPGVPSQEQKNQTQPFNGLLTDCLAYGAWHAGSSSIWEPPVPPGWEATINAAAYQLTIQIVQCSHASIGTLERPDVWIAVEYHDAIDDPEPCRNHEGRSNYVGSLLSAVTSDEAVAAWLATSLDRPVHVGLFNLTQITDAPPANRALSIEVADKLALNARFDAGTTNPDPIGIAWTDRLAVQGQGGGFSLWDFAWETLRHRQDDAAEWRVESQAPFALGTQHPSTGAMTGEIYDETDMELTIYKFTDSTCTEPL